MKDIVKKIRTNRLLFLLVFITIVSIIIGILFLAIQNGTIKNQISSSLSNIIEEIKLNRYDSFSVFVKSMKTNTIIAVLIWILGISMIGIPLILLIYIIKGIMLGFTIVSFIYFYKLKGIIIGLIYIIPYILNIFIIFIMSYYAIRFSTSLFIILTKNKNFNGRLFIKKYFKVLIINLIFLLISALIEGFLIPVLLKLIII